MRAPQCHYPNRPTETARHVKRSPLHERLAARGAYFRDVSGWEGADWYGGPAAAAPGKAVSPPSNGPLTWGKPAWFETWAAEHMACRDACALIDMSFMSKFLVQGNDAAALLNRLATADVSTPPPGSGWEEGAITYTQFLSPRGTLEADLTVTRLPHRSLTSGGAAGGADAYLVVATDTAHRHVEMLLTSGIGSEHSAALVTDVSGAFAQINLQGPRSREILTQLTSVDVSEDAFPFRAARRLDIGCATLLATRITYVGELGYELFVPAEMAVHVYDEIVRVGEPLGLAHVGLRALGSLRMEKGYRDYGHDMDNCDTLLEVGLGFTACFDKAGGFVGSEATAAQKQRAKDAGGLSKRLVQILLADPDPLMYHGEVVYRDGEIVGDVRSASYGHTLGGAVGLSMVEDPGGAPVTPAWVREGKWEVDVAGVRYPATASLRPLFDPKNAKIHARESESTRP